MRPSTGVEYSDDRSFEFARNSSAASQSRFSRSVVLVGRHGASAYWLWEVDVRDLPAMAEVKATVLTDQRFRPDKAILVESSSANGKVAGRGYCLL